MLGIGNSACKMCCNSEPVLSNLLEKLKGKNIMSYPYKDKKSKKIIRKEIPIARIDVKNKDFIEQLRFVNIIFSQDTMIFVVKEEVLHKWDAHFAQFNHLPYFM